MKSNQHHFVNNNWIEQTSNLNNLKCQLVLAFGSPACIAEEPVLLHLKELYPNADIIAASTAGEIINGGVYDDSVVATAIEFEKTALSTVKTNISNHLNSFETGKHLFSLLNKEDLKGVFVISDGTLVNGDELVEGFRANNALNVPITGGLAGDGARFQKTLTGMNEVPSQGNVIAVGFYGDAISIGHGSMGGWEEFGFERVITRSNKNTLHDIDEKNALELYKNYLGDYANELPGSALLFPLSVKANENDKALIRTVLAIDNDQQTMTFAGNLPEGNKVRLMRADFDNLIDASSIAAKDSLAGINKKQPDLTIMISCVGRKIVLDSRTWEEVKNVEEILGSGDKIAGFYSYGGISPFGKGTCCELHNQTMTITTFTEA